MSTPTETIEPSYYQHEQWFEVQRVVESETNKVIKIRVVNSYGRVRDLYPDGGYITIHDGGSK